MFFIHQSDFQEANGKRTPAAFVLQDKTNKAKRNPKFVEVFETLDEALASVPEDLPVHFNDALFTNRKEAAEPVDDGITFNSRPQLRQAVQDVIEDRISSGVVVDGVRFACDTGSLVRLHAMRDEVAGGPKGVVTFMTAEGVSVSADKQEIEDITSAANAFVIAQLQEAHDVQVRVAEADTLAEARKLFRAWRDDEEQEAPAEPVVEEGKGEKAE